MDKYTKPPKGPFHIGIIIDNNIRKIYSERLKSLGYLVTEYSSPDETWKTLDNFHVLVCDTNCGGNKLGYKFADKVAKRYPSFKLASSKPLILMQAIKTFEPQLGKKAARVLSWNLKELEGFTRALEQIITDSYSKHLFIAGEPVWALDAYNTVKEVMPRIYNNLEDLKNDSGQAYGIIMGPKIRRSNEQKSPLVPACTAKKELKKYGFEGMIHPYKTDVLATQEDLLSIIKKMIKE